MTYPKSRTSFDVGGFLDSAGGTGKETVEAGVCGTVKETVEAVVGNDTDNEGGIVSDVMRGACIEKYRTDTKNTTSADTKYLWRDYRTCILFEF